MFGFVQIMNVFKARYWSSHAFVIFRCIMANCLVDYSVTDSEDEENNQPIALSQDSGPSQYEETSVGPPESPLTKKSRGGPSNIPWVVQDVLDKMIVEVAGLHTAKQSSTVLPVEQGAGRGRRDEELPFSSLQKNHNPFANSQEGGELTGQDLSFDTVNFRVDKLGEKFASDDSETDSSVSSSSSEEEEEEEEDLEKRESDSDYDADFERFFLLY